MTDAGNNEAPPPPLPPPSDAVAELIHINHDIQSLEHRSRDLSPIIFVDRKIQSTVDLSRPADE